jgi:hypothetical protein
MGVYVPKKFFSLEQAAATNVITAIKSIKRLSDLGGLDIVPLTQKSGR